VQNLCQLMQYIADIYICANQAFFNA